MLSTLSTLGYWLISHDFCLWVAVVAGAPLSGMSVYQWKRR